MPFPSEYHIALLGVTIEDATYCLNTTLEDLDLQWQYRPSLATGVGFAKANVWSRAARRQQQKRGEAGADQTGKDEDAEPALGFKVQVSLGKEMETLIVIRWLQGHDSVLFESLCGMLKRLVSVV